MADAADHATIRRLEELGRLGWPALETTEIDGWLAGSSGSYTRRANSVAPVATGELSLDARLARVEAHYARRGARPVFKMTEAAVPSGLEQELEERGYRRASETIVMTAGVDAVVEKMTETISESGPRIELIANRVEADWFSASTIFSGVSSSRHGDYRALLAGCIDRSQTTLFGRAEVGGRVQSVALGCVAEGTVSLVQVATALEARGRRYADRVLRGIFFAARELDVTLGLLSVEASNASARKLYERLGFTPRYRYWYREAPE